MIKKISFYDIENVRETSDHGLSDSSIMFGVYGGKQVTIKAQKTGTLKKYATQEFKANDYDRFEQEKDILCIGIPGVVNPVAWGDDCDGERFLVMERLYPLPASLENQQVLAIAKAMIVTYRMLYLHGYALPSNIKHIMFDANDSPTLIDFNDDNIVDATIASRIGRSTKDMFLKPINNYDYLGAVRDLAKKYGLNPDKVSDASVAHLVEGEYQSLENAHQPIFMRKYAKTRKTETSKDSPGYMTLVKPNRKCEDRAEMIMNALSEFHEQKRTVLDIGSNLGWFSFMLDEMGYIVKGVDFDKHTHSTRPAGWPNGDAGKVEFCRMMADLSGSGAEFDSSYVDLGYLRAMPKYDIIMALSILHLYIHQHKMGKDEWMAMFTELCRKVGSVLIFETSNNILGPLGLGSQEDLARMSLRIGGFRTTEIIGTSDANRPLIMCRR